mgnify:CR=1 FL=1
MVESFKSPGFWSEDHCKLNVASNLLKLSKLHQLVREKGGAYGAGCTLGDNHVMSLWSYRDPNYLKTYVNYEQSI